MEFLGWWEIGGKRFSAVTKFGVFFLLKKYIFLKNITETMNAFISKK
ncbi:hypothetical protein [Sulfuricurvum sp.]|nr:hypothetical protein [Sulfuricurvum sp.]MDD3594839.1 hypothetical protein [Sulfuricurvum sp.]